MRRNRTIPILVAGALVAAGCNSNNAPDTTAAEPGMTTTTVVETTTPDDDALIPEGTYRSGMITRDELFATGVAAGFDAEEVEEALFDRVEIVHRLAGGEWTTTVSFDGAPPEVAADGTYEVVDADRVIVDGRCGGSVTLGYEIDGDAVTFEVIDDECEDLGDRLATVLIFESAPFARIADEAGDGTVTLVFGNAYSHGFPLGSASYFEAVNRLTGGTINVVSDGDNRDGDPQAEQSLIDDVRRGVVDIAVIGPRFFSTLGVDRVAALAPPMLIDSYDLEREVFARDLPSRLLSGLDELGVVAVAVMPGPLQKLAGFDRTFRTLDDFGGAVVSAGVGMGEDVVAALGATSQPWVGGSPFTGFDGIVITVGGMNGRQVDLVAEAATGNLNLFAFPWIVIVNRDTYASLDAEQQAALRDAGSAAVDAVIESNIAGQDEALQLLCAAGLEFVTMSGDDLANIRTALEPIYADLTADPEVAAYVEEVEQLKADLGVGPDSVTCPATTSRPGDDEPLPEGLYRTREVTRAELIATAAAAGFDQAMINAGLDDWVFEDTKAFGLRLVDGVWTQLESDDGGPEVIGWRATYEVIDDDTVIATGTGPSCERITYSYAFDGEQLTLDVVEVDGGDRQCDWVLMFETFIHETAPYVRVDEDG